MCFSVARTNVCDGTKCSRAISVNKCSIQTEKYMKSGFKIVYGSKGVDSMMVSIQTRMHASITYSTKAHFFRKIFALRPLKNIKSIVIVLARQ